MTNPTMERQQLIETVRSLPDEVLFELASFLDYLRYKSRQEKDASSHSNFLTSITGLGASGQQNTAENDEEILRTEIDPVHGWTLNPSNQG